MAKFGPEWQRYIAKLRALRTAVAPALEPVMRQAGETVVAAQRQLVPVDQGDLRQSIHYTLKETKVTVQAGGPAAPYARYVEFGTSAQAPQPYFFTGYRAVIKPVRRMINKAIKQAVHKVMA